MEIFYLKMNQNTISAYRYLWEWLNVVRCFPDSKVYFLVDKPEIVESIRRTFNLSDLKYDFIESSRQSKDLQYITQHFTTGPVGYALLTPFLHSIDNGYEDFWNIDADDIGLFAEPARIAGALASLKKTAQENNINSLSLDAWYSMTKASHWSFGVNYTSNSIDWISLMKSHCQDEVFIKKYVSIHPNGFITVNLDWLFTYLRSIKVANIQSFYVENLRFVVNHSPDVYRAALWGLRYCCDGRLWFSVLRDDFALEPDESSVEIPSDVIELSGITAEESQRFLAKLSREYGKLDFNVVFSNPPPPYHPLIF